MRGLRVWLAMCCAAAACLAVAGPGAGVGLAADAGADSPNIAALYPNPVAEGDASEFVVLDVPEGTDLSNYQLTDGESTVTLPAVDPGEVALTSDGTRAATLAGYRTAPLDGTLRLSNAGETVRLLRNGTAVDEASYRNAPESEIFVVGRDTPRWRPLGATDRSVVAAGPGQVRAFVLPDAGGLPSRVVARAEDRILLGGYTLTSERVTRALVRAHRRGVTVRVLVDGGPVGGMSRRQVARLDGLADAGVEVQVVGGPRARYRFHHAKYAVVDDRALATSENWKPAGVGGRGSRGWGVVTNQTAVVEGLAETFRADAGWKDAIPWQRAREGVEPVEADPASGRYGQQFESKTVPVEGTRLLVAPDNAESAVVDLLADADDRIWVEQPSVGGVGQPFVEACLEAAKRGVRVRVLLGSAWYNEEENRALAKRLRKLASREELDLQVRLVQPRGRFAKIHAKGVVVDGDEVLLGSLNWNNNSVRRNREVALLLRGDAVGSHYESVVRADWRGGTARLLVGVGLACLLAALGAAWLARRIRFEADAGEDVPGVGP